MEELSMVSYDSDESNTYTEYQSNHQVMVQPVVRKGKAPPVDSFASEGTDLLFEEWLPAFEHMATWNKWTDSEKLIQLTGYLRGKALQEWSLLGGTDKLIYLRATATPAEKSLKPRIFAIWNETVLDFILQLEQTFWWAYGLDEETCYTLLHG